MAYILFTRTDGVRGFMETTGVMVSKGDRGEILVFEQGSDSPVRCQDYESCETISSALAWLKQACV